MACHCCQSSSVSSPPSLLIERVKYISNIVPMLDKVAKKKRILLGSMSQEGEARLKLYLLLMHLLSVMVLMLPAVMAM